MPITTPVYSTRETIKRALDINPSARNNRNIDRALESASRRIDGMCHRRFYPEVATRYFDWPNAQDAIPWRLWLDDSELISVTSMSSGGVTINAGDFILEPNRTGPPYNRLEVKTSSPAAFGGGPTHQQDIGITGVWGYTDAELSTGVTLTGLNTTQTSVDMDALVSSEVGIGAIIRLDDERCLVMNRRMLDTGSDLLGPGLTKNNGDVLVPVADGTQFEPDEIVMIGAERMLIVDIADNDLIVNRAYDGSVLDTHAPGDDIFALRTYQLMRGALGTTAAAHSAGVSVLRWECPGGIRQLATAETTHELMQEQTGWFRTMSASSNFGGTARRAATLEALVDLRDSVYRQYGRKARTRTI